MRITINLLPEQYQHHLQNRRVARSILKNGFMAALAVAVFVVFLQMCLQVIQLQKNVVQSEISRLETNSIYRKIKENQDLLKTYHRRTASIDKDLVEKEMYRPFFETINSLTPQDMYFESIKFQDKRVSIKGMGTGRSQLLEFKKNLEESGMFAKVDAPLSNFTQDKDITFEFKLDLK